MNCNLCHKTVGSQSQLLIHKRSHTNERPYCCNTCGKSFAQKGNLTIHRAIHQAIDRFICEMCNKTFSRQQNLQRHNSTFHANNFVVFECDKCDIGLISRNDLINHNNQNHKPRCVECQVVFDKFDDVQAHIEKCKKSHQCNENCDLFCDNKVATTNINDTFSIDL